MMQKINLEMLVNTRDLGGTKTKDNMTVKDNMLIRSGQLFGLSENDVEILLSHKLSLIVDFRTNQEKSAKPDPRISDVEYCSLPILQEKMVGVTRDETTITDVMKKFILSNDSNMDVEEYISYCYKLMVTNQFCLNQYTKFVDMLISNSERGATLWHCSAGKDRVGIATMIVLECLNVDRETIINDYLDTNENIKEEAKAAYSYFSSKLSTKKAEQLVSAVFYAKEEYISMVYRLIEDTYGSVMSFLNNALGINQDKIDKMKGIFLNG